MDERLRERAIAIKRRFLGMYKRANAGHVGSALSCAELLTFVRFDWMTNADTLVLSKGHAAAALYATLIEDGSLPEESALTFYGDGTLLPAHPPVAGVPGIPFATGSLGHGLSLVAGMALGCRLRGERRTLFCVTSDGELDEGSIWEGALFIAHHGLTNVVWLIDRNGLQGFGRTEDVMKLEPLEDKLRAFGFHVVAADGHDFTSLRRAKEATLAAGDARPTVIVCATTKGRGLGSLENTVDCHYLPMTDEQYAAILARLDREEEEVRGGVAR